MKRALLVWLIGLCGVPMAGISLAQTAQAGAAAPATVAADSKRVALVVGNSRYGSLAKLENALNDAGDVAKTLKKVGFEVIHVQDSNREAFFTAMQRFKQAIKPGGVSLFYYAGHGIQSNGVNYLMPVDASAENEIAVRSKGVPLDEVLGLMTEARSALKIVYLDACREDPPQLKRSTRSAARGLAEVPKAQGTIIEFSTSPGNVALDGKAGERNSPYTASLLKNIEKPGLQIEQLGKLVRAEVMSATRGKQEPWTSSSITNDFFFVPPREGQQQVIVTTIEKGPEPGAGSGRSGKKSQEDCHTEGMAKGVDQQDLYEYVQACLAGREFKLVKSGGQCMQEVRSKRIAPTDILEFMNACKYGKPWKTNPEDVARNAELDRVEAMKKRSNDLYLDTLADTPSSKKLDVQGQFYEFNGKFYKLVRNGKIDEAERLLKELEARFKR